jgi:hypothetical protein
MSVVISGVFVAPTVGLALIGLVLLLLGVLWIGASARSRRGLTLEQSQVPTRWLDVAARLLPVAGTPSAPRAPPAGRSGLLQPIPVSTFAYRRRSAPLNELP